MPQDAFSAPYSDEKTQLDKFIQDKTKPLQSLGKWGARVMHQAVIIQPNK